MSGAEGVGQCPCEGAGERAGSITGDTKVLSAKLNINSYVSF